MNANFRPEFKQYLESNGFQLSRENGSALYFFKNEIGVMVSGDSVDIANFTTNSQASVSSAFTGISKLDLQGWKMLMHITGVIDMELVKDRVTIQFIHEPITATV